MDVVRMCEKQQLAVKGLKNPENLVVLSKGEVVKEIYPNKNPLNLC